MIILVKKSKATVKKAVEMISAMQKDHENGQYINYTVPPCVVRTAIISRERFEGSLLMEDEYVIVVDLDVIDNDRAYSSGTKLITAKRSTKNILRIIRELEAISIG